MSITAVETGPATTAEVLAVLRGGKADRDAADIAMVRATIEWAVLNEVEPDDWSCQPRQSFGDRPFRWRVRGAPLVSEFAAMEYAAALGMSTDAGKAYLGRALELRYRLPRLWARVVAGKLSVWRAGRIADQTISLPLDGAGVRRPASGSGGALVFVGAAGAHWSRKRWCGSTPRPRKPSASRQPNVVTSTSMSTRSPTTAPSRSTASSTWPMPWILRTRSGPGPDSSQPVGTPSP